jgi:hypothetical protein
MSPRLPQPIANAESIEDHRVFVCSVKLNVAEAPTLAMESPGDAPHQSSHHIACAGAFFVDLLAGAVTICKDSSCAMFFTILWTAPTGPVTTMRTDPIEAVRCAIQMLGKGCVDVMIAVVDPSKGDKAYGPTEFAQFYLEYKKLSPRSEQLEGGGLLVGQYRKNVFKQERRHRAYGGRLRSLLVSSSSSGFFVAAIASPVAGSTKWVPLHAAHRTSR